MYSHVSSLWGLQVLLPNPFLVFLLLSYFPQDQFRLLPRAHQVLPSLFFYCFLECQPLDSKGMKISLFLWILVTAQPVSEDASEKDHQSKDVSGDSIRRRFLDFYASRGHKVLPSASLVPEDPTVLLTIAGMLQFKPVFLGKVSIIIQFHRCFETVS